MAGRKMLELNAQRTLLLVELMRLALVEASRPNKGAEGSVIGGTVFAFISDMPDTIKAQCLEKVWVNANASAADKAAAERLRWWLTPLEAS